MEQNRCLWCGAEYSQGMEGVCRECWDKNQFPKKELCQFMKDKTVEGVDNVQCCTSSDDTCPPNTNDNCEITD
jgi:hypothetical protein